MLDCALAVLVLVEGKALLQNLDFYYKKPALQQKDESTALLKTDEC